MGTEDTQQILKSKTRELPRVTALRQTKRLIVLVVGSTLIAAGLALIVLPGPFTIPLVLLGLTVLGTEFAWARRLLVSTKRQVRKAVSRRGSRR
jgi:hypothetical protein